MSAPTTTTTASAPAPAPAPIAVDRHLNPLGSSFDLARPRRRVLRFFAQMIICNFLPSEVPVADRTWSGIRWRYSIQKKGMTVRQVVIGATNANENASSSTTTTTTTPPLTQTLSLPAMTSLLSSSNPSTTCIWVISSKVEVGTPSEMGAFIDALDVHHENGGGLMLFGDNNPYNVTVNAFLNRFGVANKTANIQHTQNTHTRTHAL